MESGSDKSTVGPSRSDKRNQDCSETSKRVLPTVGPGEPGIGEAEGGPAKMLRILLKQNTALLSTVRPCVCVCHRRDITQFSHI